MAGPEILIVDDDRLTRLLLRVALIEGGYSVLEAENAREALQRFKSRVDLVLLDVRLPDANGLDLLIDFKEIEPACPVIVMTSMGSAQDLAQALSGGAYHYATKPFDTAEMLKMIGGALLPKINGAKVLKKMTAEAVALDASRLAGSSSEPFAREPSSLPGLNGPSLEGAAVS